MVSVLEVLVIREISSARCSTSGFFMFSAMWVGVLTPKIYHLQPVMIGLKVLDRMHAGTVQTMNHLIRNLFLGLLICVAQNQIKAQTPPPTADPYANNPDAGKLQFPLAAPA